MKQETYSPSSIPKIPIADWLAYEKANHNPHKKVYKFPPVGTIVQPEPEYRETLEQIKARKKKLADAIQRIRDLDIPNPYANRSVKDMLDPW